MEIGTDRKLNLRNPWRLAGALAVIVFGLLLLGCLHLVWLGHVVEARSGRVPAKSIHEDGGPVIYFYTVGETMHHGWRRGIQWGEQRLSVVYSPFIARAHFTSLNPRLQRPGELWRETDFVLRVVLFGTGTVVGLLLFALADKLPTGLPSSWTLLPGLNPQDKRA